MAKNISMTRLKNARKLLAELSLKYRFVLPLFEMIDNEVTEMEKQNKLLEKARAVLAES